MEELDGVIVGFFFDFYVVVLCACRDHILRGILPFLTIPFYNIFPEIYEYLSNGNEGVFVWYLFSLRFFFEIVSYATIIFLFS